MDQSQECKKAEGRVYAKYTKPMIWQEKQVKKTCLRSVLEKLVIILNKIRRD